MSFLDTINQQQEPTVEQVARQLKQQAGRAYQAMVLAHEQGFRDFWTHPTFTPQELATALGTDAVEMFRIHWILNQTIKAANPDQIIADVADYGTSVMHEDGTVTVTKVDPKADPA